MVLNKALAGQSVTISVLGGSGIPFSLPLSTPPDSTYERLISVSMPRCRERSYIPHMLPIPLLPVMEHRLSPPSYRQN